MPVATRIRTLRERKGLSLRALADAAGISPATLSQIEQNQTSPSVATLEKLAHGLRLPIAAFFAESEEESPVEVLSMDGGVTFKLREGAELVPMAAQRHPSSFEPILVRLQPGGCLGEQPFLIGIESEFVWVRKGRVILHFDGSDIEVTETQYVYYDPRRPHNWRNPFETMCELLMVRQR